MNAIGSQVNAIGSQVGALSGRVDRLGVAVDEARSIAIAAGALSMAASQIRFDERPGKVSVGVAGGLFHDQGAVAVGLGYTAPSQWWRANVSGSFAGSDERSVGAGVSFTLN
jgi:autotransporter adhesin